MSIENRRIDWSHLFTEFSYNIFPDRSRVLRIEALIDALIGRVPKQVECPACKGKGKVLGKNDAYGIANTVCCFCNGTGVN